MELQSIIYYVGLVTSLYLFGSLAQHIYTFLRPSTLPRYLHGSKDGKNRESWALVTGASDGIGLSFAQELCGHGFNVLLHGRNRQKLLGVQEQLRKQYPTSKTRIVVFDASDSASIDSIDEKIHEFGGRRDGEKVDDDEVNLTVLINNVGGTGAFPPDVSPFPSIHNHTPSQLDGMLNLNARFTAHLTRLLLPTLIRNGPSLVMNISSTAAVGMPFTSIYAGSKGFIDSFTKSVKSEMLALGKDVDVLGIKLSNVRSGGHKVETGFATPTARTFARAALNRVGNGGAIVWGYWPHALQMFTLQCLHESVIRKVFIKAMTKIIEEDNLEREQKKQK
ncbi:hypothetical protein FQN54_009264 [Arachnomyces sp. PD_36]|nr:hypothetical protein FQN54_009264 [Arachnomyces sp. PD_36]